MLFYFVIIKMGQNIKFKQNWKWWEFVRPVVIIKKFNNDVFWWVALSTKIKDWLYYYCFDANWTKQCAIISQFRLYDKNRLIKKIGMISIKDFFSVKTKNQKPFVVFDHCMSQHKLGRSRRNLVTEL